MHTRTGTKKKRIRNRRTVRIMNLWSYELSCSCSINGANSGAIERSDATERRLDCSALYCQVVSRSKMTIAYHPERRESEKKEAMRLELCS